VSLRARRDGLGWRLDGHKGFVLDGASADLILVAARMDERFGVLAVEGDAAGLVRASLPTLDPTRKLSRLEFDGARAAPIAGPLAWGELEQVLQLAAVALCAEQLGVAQKALEMAVDYAKLRRQFGRPIGSFQAIKHKCADVLVEVESARAAAYYAAWVASAKRDELALASSVAKAHCSEACLRAAAENIQIHGGLGFTWEHDAHLYFKRARSSYTLLGEPSYYLERTADQIAPSTS
jgi:alkylation response protein AidB-like acyl-CoA dehydrogenase